MTGTSKQQKEWARLLYEGQLNEQEIIEQQGLSKLKWQRLMQSKVFQQELHGLCESTLRETRLILARYGPVAALRLAELLDSDKPDIARRAALDLIEHCMKHSAVEAPIPQSQDTPTQLTDEQARQMLLTLARGLAADNTEKD